MLLYLITDGNFYKIGITGKSIHTRIKQLQTGSPFELKIIKTVNCSNNKHAAELESFFHKKYDFCRMSGEWFNFKNININELIHQMEIFSDMHVFLEYKRLKYEIYKITPNNLKKIKKVASIEKYESAKKELEIQIDKLFGRFNKNLKK